MAHKDRSTGITAFAGIHNDWLNELFDSEIPKETSATCHSCAMCTSNPMAEKAFSPVTKCCTYWPVLPNYLVGSALSDMSDGAREGRERLTAMLSEVMAVPNGLGVSQSHQALYTSLRATGFGVEEKMLCPYFDKATGGQCSIWRHRNAVCATYHCKYRRGATGMEFWQAMKRLLKSVEGAVALWSAVEMGIPVSVARIKPRSSIERGRDASNGWAVIAKAPAHMWGKWNHRRADFYVGCFAKARSLSWQDVLRLGGVELEILVSTAQKAFQANLKTRVVDRVIPAPVMVLRRSSSEVFLQTYSPYDHQRLDARVFHGLRHCSGQPVADLRETMKQVDGVEVDDALLERLIDNRIVTVIR
ncbi:MAG: hypothetical protein K2Y23_03570 [Cyanobacteria bacterium]|nr:hypothetical protein [Cyanobacteriota bacterium]